MKIQCQSCQAKYTIADEKVLGKVVKIRCKKCSATIVINGNETRPGEREDNQDTNVFDYAGQANDPWTVNVADGDQRTMTGQEIVAEYRTGVVTDETYCWKDGMADWLPLREIEQLFGAVKLAPAGRGIAHSLHDGEFGDAPQSIPPAGNAGALFSANEAAAAVESPFAGGGAGGGSNGNGNGYHAPEPAYAAPIAAASAARRGGGRGQGADLFGNVASAGGEEEVMTSAPTGAAAMHGGGGGAMEEQKLTGQRNESSVLFSLSALTEGGKAESAAAANRTTATSDGSGLIDIRALSQTMGSDDKKDTNARVDDIMNLSGGGAFGAALAAPILAPPPLEMSNDAYGAYGAGGGQKSNKMLFIAIIAGAAMIAIGIVVAVIVARPTVAPIDATNTGPAGTASAMASAATGAVAANDPNAAPTGAVTAPAAIADNTPPPPGTGNANAKTPAVTGAAKPAAATGGGAAAHTAAVAAADPAPAVPKTPEPPKDFAGALAAAAGKPKDTPADTGGGGGATAPFDRGAAAGALGGVNVQSCKKPDGPTGGGHVTITFAPNGSVSSAVVDQGPFPGTPVGGCIAGKFRAAHIPAFAGGAVKAGKSFTIN